MANSEKLTKGLSDKSKKTLIMTIVIALILVCVGGYFVYISGLVPRLLTGAKIVETVDGTQKTLDNISVLQMRYHYQAVVQQYNMYGYGSQITDYDQPADPTTGKTYRDQMLDQAAMGIVNCWLINREADNNPDFVSGSERYDEMNISSLESTAESYGYSTVDMLLQGLYGRGMTLRLYKQFCNEQTVNDEYQYYVRQFICVPTDEEIQAVFDQDPGQYDKVNFNFYYFPAIVDAAGNVDPDSLADVTAKAQSVADTAADSATFRAAVMEALEGQDTALEAFADDKNPTYCEDYTRSSMTYFAEGFTEFLFDEANPGDTKVIATDNGAYVLLLVDHHCDDDITVSYRSLTLQRDENETTEEMMAQAAAIAGQVTDEKSFNNLVKQYSEDANEIMTGGINAGVQHKMFEPNQNGWISQQNSTVGAWLFDEVRVKGDVNTVMADDGLSVTIYFFVRSNPAWMDTIREQLTNEKLSDWSANVMATNPTYVIDYETVKRFL